MRILIRVGIVLAVLLAVALGALALWLPRLVESPAVRQRIETAAREATGREVTYRELSVGLFPPRLVVAGPVVAGATPQAPPFAEAESVGLRLAVAPLLARAVVVDSLVVEGATVRLRRTADGIELPRPERDEEPGPPGEEGAPDEEAGLALAVRELELRDVRVLLEDVAVSPAVTWDLSGVDGTARVPSLEEPIELRVSATLGSGGTLEGRGTVTLGGPVDLSFDLEDVETAPAAPYLGRGRTLAGTLSGAVGVRGGADAPEAVKADLVLEDGEVRVEDLHLRGRLAVEADLDGPGLAGPFEIDATAAQLDYGDGVFTKPAGRPATAAGRVVPREGGGYDVDDVKVEMHNLDATGRVRTGERIRASLRAPAFPLAGWDALLPGLRGYDLGGSVAVPELEVATAPLDLVGQITLDEVRLAPPRSPPVVVDGALRGRGQSLALEGVSLTTADQTLAISGGVEGLASRPRLSLGVRGEDLDSEALVRAYTGRDFLAGPLSLQGDVATPLGGERPVLQALSGRVRWDMAEGRIRGVSLLKQTFGALGRAAEAAVLVNRIRGSDKLERFYEDRFESASGTFRLGDGLARTDDMRLVYRHYIADLRGSIGLADLALDLTGEIIVDEEVDATLAGEERTAGQGERTVIPLARVTGTADAPRVDLSPRAVTSLAARYAFGRERSELERRLDEELGEGAGRAAGELLEDILKGRQRSE